MRAVGLHFIGSGDAFGRGGRLQACLRLSGAGPTVLIDCGASSLAGMKRDCVDPNDVDMVVLSHLHGDHFAGLPYLVLDGQFAHRERSLTIVGPPGTADRLTATMEALFPGSSTERRRFDVQHRAIAPGESITVGGVEITAYAAAHASGAQSLSLRVGYGGRTIAYSGDTEWTDELAEVARDADVFVCEAYYFERPVRYHLDWATLRDHRSELSCQRLILTHMSKDMLDRVQEVDGDVTVARDGLMLTV